MRIELSFYEIGLLFSFLLIMSGISFAFQQIQNLILILLGFELILFGCGFLFLTFSHLLDYPVSRSILFIFLTLGGAETVLGLTLIVLYYHQKSNLKLIQLTDLKG